MKKYLITKQYSHINFYNDGEQLANNLYELVDSLGINYTDADLEELEKDLENGETITINSLNIRKVSE